MDLERKAYRTKYFSNPINYERNKRYMQIYRIEHKDIMSKQKRKHYDNNVDNIKKRAKIHHMTRKQKPECVLHDRKYKHGYYVTTKDTPKKRLDGYKGNAKRRNIEFSLTIDEFQEFWQKPCYYCGDKINTIGLDRINNSMGYKIGNVVPCCEWCNRQKLGYSAEEFIEHAKKIVLHKRD